MPSRKKKSTARPKKDKAGISINIKNVMKQVQNERPRQRTDFINPSRKNPNHNLNNGSMTRMFAPAVTYASTPLSAFPSLASIDALRGKPQEQLTSNSKQPLGLGPSVVQKPEEDEKNDPLEKVVVGKRATASNPLPVASPSGYVSGYRTPQFQGAFTPSFDARLSTQLDALLAQRIAQQEQSEYLVARQMDEDIDDILAQPTPQAFTPVRRSRSRMARDEDFLTPEQQRQQVGIERARQTRAANARAAATSGP